jgi:N-acyl-D-amino-acid deacylase
MNGHIATAVLLIGLAFVSSTCAAEPNTEQIESAVKQSLVLIVASAKTYTSHESCFTCHHQALPAMTVALASARGFQVDSKSARRQSEFTHADFSARHSELVHGKGVLGGPYAAGYALVSLAVNDWPPDDTTAALVAYLLKRQHDDGHWAIQTHRPPLEDSHFTATALAIRGLKSYPSPEQAEEIQQRIAKARQWLVENQGKTTEDKSLRLLGLKWAEATTDEIESASKELAGDQRSDGGWAQEPDMASDAYATGQALVALHEAGCLATAQDAYRRGLVFLLSNQHDDGSWKVETRNRPIQTYFESGYPHGKSQFISISAACWATMALTLTQPETTSEFKKP